MDGRTVVVNLRVEPYDVYIGRPGRDQDGYFGNPFHSGVDGSRREVIEKFRQHFIVRLKDPEYRRRVEGLRGRRLGCFCKPLACHGDVIVEYLNDGGRRMKVISGGQTGADRAGLDAAKTAGLPTGGYAPSNYWTERGPDPTLEVLGLVAGGSLAWRTERNVVCSDATVVFQTHSSPGSNMTVAVTARHGKPIVILNPWSLEADEDLRHFLKTYRPRTLNVAGHRKSKAPGIYRQVYNLLLSVFRTVQDSVDCGSVNVGDRK